MSEYLKLTKEFVVKENEGFRIRVKSWNCLAPKGLKTVHFINECIRDGEVDFTSTYEFFLTDDEIKTLTEGLLK